MSVHIRPAESDDRDVAVPLLLDAGERLLTTIFGNGDREAALNYLTHAWQEGAGQYGFTNHWVAQVNDQIAGLVTCWHDKLPADFDRATLTSITDHFGLDGSIDVVMRSQQFSAALHPPTPTELAIGHLAVAHSARRKQVGSALLGAMYEKAVSLRKFAIVLDVEAANTGAVAFYLANGFGEHRACPPFLQMIKAVELPPR